MPNQHGASLTTWDSIRLVASKLREGFAGAPEKLRELLTGQSNMLRFALIAGVLIALCAALLGVTLVLKRYSLIGDGLSHVAFGAMTVAGVLSIAPMAVSLPVTIVISVLLLRGDKAKLKGDSAIAMLSVSALAIGYLLMNLFAPVSQSSNLSADVCSVLFGSTQKSILMLTAKDLLLCAILALVVIFVYSFFFNKIFSVTFDETFAEATGTHVKAFRVLLAVIIAITIVLAIRLVGALLITALIVFPTLCALRLFKSFRGVVACAVVISVLCAVSGILLGAALGTPMGSTIVVVDLTAFGLCILIDAVIGVFVK